MEFVQSPSGGSVMAVGCLLAYLAVLLWARQPSHRDRWLVITAATVMGLAVFLVNQIARALGWWGWWGYALPLPVQAALLGLGPAIFFVLLLSGYRWLIAHSRRPFLNYGLIMFIVLVPLTVLADLYGLERQKLAFGGGYTIWHDVLVGQAFAWLPVLLYHAIHRATVKPSWRI